MIYNFLRWLITLKLVQWFINILFVLAILVAILDSSPILLIPFIAIIILILFINGTFVKIVAKNKVSKECGKVKFGEKISLFKSTDKNNLNQFNLEHFDKKMLDYKKHLLFLTENSIVIIGYNTFKATASKMYQKEYKLNNIQEISIGYKTNKWTETHYKKQTTSKKVTNTYTGHSHWEETTEDVPYKVNREQDLFTYGQITFKNTIVESVLFSFASKFKSLDLAKKLMKVCSKLNIIYDIVPDKD